MLASNAQLDDFRARAGSIIRVELLDAQGRACGPANADFARVTKRTFDNKKHTIRCELDQAVAIAGPQCLQERRA